MSNLRGLAAGRRGRCRRGAGRTVLGQAGSPAARASARRAAGVMAAVAWVYLSRLERLEESPIDTMCRHYAAAGAPRC